MMRGAGRRRGGGAGDPAGALLPGGIHPAARARAGLPGPRVVRWAMGLLAVNAGALLLAYRSGFLLPPVRDPAAAAAAAAADPAAGRRGDGHARALLLSSHGRALWWDAAAGAELSELHSGAGVYYGVVPGAPLPADDPEAPGGATTWVVSRAHNWRGTEGAGRERLLQLAGAGRVAGEAPFSARFSHDAVLAPAEGGSPARALVADTGGGAVVELDPATMAEVRRHEVFTRRDHVNTLAPSLARPGHVWALLHGKGSGARLALVDLAEGRVVHKTRRFGADCHGLVMLRRKRAPDGMPGNREWEVPDGGRPLEDRWLTLNSGEGQVLVLEGLEEEALGGPPMRTKVLWADAKQTFMKGLAAVDGVAYFGISEWGDRDERASPEKRAEVAAFDLNSGFLLWRRWVDTRGLLNVVSAPQLGATSTYRESASWAPAPAAGDFSRQFAGASLGADGGGEGGAGPGGAPEGEGVPLRHGASPAAQAGGGAVGPPVTFAPAFDASRTVSLTGEPSFKWLSLECKGPVDADELPENCRDADSLDSRLQVPYGEVDVRAVQAYLHAHPEIWDREVQRVRNVFVEGRSRVLEKFKPGTGGVMLIFSGNGARDAYTFPMWEELRPLLEPVIGAVLKPVLGQDWDSHLLRVQFAVMPPGSQIKRHVDTGKWVRAAHRLHIPIFVPTGTLFEVKTAREGRFRPLDLREGHAFELNNRLPHRVGNTNAHGEDRVHLLVDFTERAKPRPFVPAGTRCRSRGEALLCPDPEDVEDGDYDEPDPGETKR